MMTILHLSKEYLKFSAAHFLIFDAQRAEKLHGHNYRVEIDFYWSQVTNPHLGLCADFKVLKDLVRSELEKWDERVLLPAQCNEMKFIEETQSLGVHFRDRIYVFPKDEVVLLPIVNTSVELLSQLFAERLWASSSRYVFKGLKVYVEETPGQGGIFIMGEIK
jgi:6-pyruvoyltetrahydropterin/6-carboxytetrahydropterin synthase